MPSFSKVSGVTTVFDLLSEIVKNSNDKVYSEFWSYGQTEEVYEGLIIDLKVPIFDIIKQRETWHDCRSELNPERNIQRPTNKEEFESFFWSNETKGFEFYEEVLKDFPKEQLIFSIKHQIKVQKCTHLRNQIHEKLCEISYIKKKIMEMGFDDIYPELG